MLTSAYSRPKGLPLYTTFAKKAASAAAATSGRPELDIVTSYGTSTFYCAPWQSLCLAVPIILVSGAVAVRTVSLLVDLRKLEAWLHARLPS